MRVGVYQYDEKVSPSLACDRAKLACDQAKKQPEQSWCLYTSAMQEKEELKQYLIDHLDEAIEKHYLQVYYQPVIRTLTGRLCGAEALIRWIDPVKGFLSPGDFIPLRLLYVNEEFQKEVKRAPAVFKQIVNEWNKPESEIAKRLHAFAKKVDQGEASYFDFKQTEQYLRLSAQQIARHENYQMLLINASDITVQYLK